MKYSRLARAAAIGAAVTLAVGANATASSWNERTILRFSAPVMIPGTTLQPGTYVFKLARTQGDRNIVQVFTKGQQKLIAQTVTVPTKRQTVNGDIVLKFDPTEAGAAPALKAFFYPGSLYGHEFVYPDAQAREIATRTRTVVLSSDQTGTDLERGTLRIVDASGTTRAWQPDTNVQQEWNRWRTTASGATANDNPGSAADNGTVTAEPAARSERVKVDEIDHHPRQYVGRTVTVDADVQDVFGPRVFSIHESSWGDLNGGILVVMPTDLAALVKQNDRVSVTGTLERFTPADLRRELTWFEPSQQLALAVQKKPVLVASRVVGGNDSRLLAIRVTTLRNTQPATTSGSVGTAGHAATAATPPNEIRSLAEIAGNADVGRHVDVDHVTVRGLSRQGAFWVRGAGDTDLLVMPAPGTRAEVKPGNTVSITGTILQMPRGRRDTLAAPDRMQQDVYIYATRIGS